MERRLHSAPDERSSSGEGSTNDVSLASYGESESEVWTTGHISVELSGDGTVSPELDTAVLEAAGEAEIVQDSNQPHPGDRFGRYIILERLGRGGMGVVYGVYDADLDRKIALKLLRDNGRIAEGVTEGRARLLREAKAMARLSHPNVVTVHDVGTFAGRVFVAMEYVDGTTMTRWGRRPGLTWREIVEVFRKAGEGLAAAHAAGLVHRDFKPDNVLIGKDGRVKVTDFGLARAVESGHVDAEARVTIGDQRQIIDDLTQPGLVMGTPPYMAPEQGAGVPADHRMDQFSYCVAFFEALYGKRPFRGKTRAELRAQILEGRVREPPRGHQVPKWVHEIVLRGLVADPDRRWPSMDAIVERLKGRPRRKRRAVAGLVGAGVVGALSVGAVTFPDTHCPNPDERLQGIWDHDQRVEAREGLLATERPHGEDSWIRVERSIDAYTKTWKDQFSAVCNARQHTPQMAEVLGRREQCLDERLAEVSALVDLLANADVSVADQATWAASTLSELTPCTGSAMSWAMTNSADANDGRALRIALARAGIYARIGEPYRGLPLVHDVIERAKSNGDNSVTASASRLLGLLQARAGELDAAATSLEKAVLQATRTDQHRLAAEAANALITASGAKDYHEGLLWGWYAETAIERLEEHELEDADRHRQMGELYLSHGRLSEAQEQFEAASVRFREHLGDRHPALAHTLLALGQTLEQQGRTTEAMAQYSRALQIAQQAYGHAHPALLPVLEALTSAASRAGEDGLAEVYRGRTDHLRTLLQ